MVMHTLLTSIGDGCSDGTLDETAPSVTGAQRFNMLSTGRHICAYCATCSWGPLAMLNPQFVGGEHSLFGGHKSEDIRAIS